MTLAVCIILVLLVDNDAYAAAAQLKIRVIWAHNFSNHVDSSLTKLIKSLGELKYTGYELKTQTTLALKSNDTQKIKLQNGALLKLTLLEYDNDTVRLEIEIPDLKFKTKVSIAKNATLAIGGPPYENGVLIIALSQKS
ncbi:MAG: hypothetical protein JW841_15680 [Deltaproteobacteria bacterium]|nr:hypothetical protein [Deltaproteobacteria bacterium]